MAHSTGFSFMSIAFGGNTAKRMHLQNKMLLSLLRGENKNVFLGGQTGKHQNSDSFVCFLVCPRVKVFHF